MQKFLLSAIIGFAGIAAAAQSPTVVTTATNCIVIHHFNATNEGFSSPSIYSNADDVAFNWSSSAGVEIETSGLTVRSGSLISPVYMQAIEGNTTIGFRYEAPIGTEFRIRVISGIVTPPLEILATTANGPVYTPLPALSGNICLLLTDADLTLGTLIRFEFTFRSNHVGDVIFDDMAQATQAIPLPVEFEGFVARKNTDGSIKLLWDVGLESNVRGYHVESSTNGINFKDAGYVTATGASIYSFDFPDIPVQTMFFRVRNIDFDGASKYTMIIRIYANGQLMPAMKVYPVPATDQVMIQHIPSAQPATITLIGMDGRILKQLYAVPNTYQTQVDIRTLPRGIYLVRYTDGQSISNNGKLIKN